jgi:Ras GTPase-activating protein 3
MMTKHAQNRRKRFGRRNFKQRYFRLTTHSLSYSKAKGKKPICDIPLTELVAVERLEERSFKMQNIFRVSFNFTFNSYEEFLIFVKLGT